MRRVLNAAMGLVLLLALAALPSCVPPPNPYSASPGAGATKLGSAGAASESQPPPAVPLKNATVDQDRSRALTDYLKAHHLPLVGAQVLSAPDGQREVILFGYVATPFGKTDAEQKARTFDGSSNLVVINRVTVTPDLAQESKSPKSGTNGDSSGVQAYEQEQFEDPYQQYQTNQYQSQSSNSSGLSTMLGLMGLLGGFGGSFGGGGFGGSFGGFGTAIGPYGGGYPNYPPPMPGGFGPGPPYSPYP